MTSSPISRLLDIMAQLRTLNSGCAWDLAQTSKSIAPCTLEEAYEVVDAIDNGTPEDLCGELGDLLLQVVFHARIAEEAGEFSFVDVVQAITSKLIRRHPHIFADKAGLSAEEVAAQWDAIKRTERPQTKRLLDDVPTALPALSQAAKLTRQAATVGFDWNTAVDVFPKLHEEIAEVREAMEMGDPAAIKEEVGDLLFVVANLARKLKVDPETALREANDKFKRRFQFIEEGLLEEGSSLEAASLANMEARWEAAKAQEKRASSYARET